MKIWNYRKGSHEIGGNCIQISSGKTTILLDAGLPLNPASQPVDLSRLIVDALLISHPHQDQFGLMATLPPGTPVYIGRLARSLIVLLAVAVRMSLKGVSSGTDNTPAVGRW